MYLKRVSLFSSIDGHVVQDFVEKLKGTMQMNLDPTRCILDGLTWVIGTPAFDKAQSKYAETTEIIDADSGSCC
jgi:hypothetical protein